MRSTDREFARLEVRNRLPVSSRRREEEHFSFGVEKRDQFPSREIGFRSGVWNPSSERPGRPSTGRRRPAAPGRERCPGSGVACRREKLAVRVLRHPFDLQVARAARAGRQEDEIPARPRREDPLPVGRKAPRRPSTDRRRGAIGLAQIDGGIRSRLPRPLPKSTGSFHPRRGPRESKCRAR